MNDWGSEKKVNGGKKKSWKRIIMDKPKYHWLECVQFGGFGVDSCFMSVYMFSVCPLWGICSYWNM